MGQGFSNDIVLNDVGTPEKSLMIFAVEGSEVNPVPSSCFFRNISQFYDKPLILMEPEPNPSQRTADYMFTKMSCKETVRSINQNFRITQTIMNDLKIWLFAPVSMLDNEKAKIMSIIKKTNFEKYSSKIDISPASIFTESDEQIPKSIGEAIKRQPRPSLKTMPFVPLKAYRPALALDTNSLASYSSNSPKTCRVGRDTCDLVVEGLYISGEKVSSDLPQLLKNGITHIVNMNASSSPSYFPEEFVYYSVHLEDSVFEVLGDEFWEGVNFTDRAIKNGGRVLIHCRMGMSRSAALCLAYLIQCRGFSQDDAMEILREARPCVSINKGFIQQIEEKVAENAEH